MRNSPVWAQSWHQCVYCRGRRHSDRAHWFANVILLSHRSNRAKAQLRLQDFLILKWFDVISVRTWCKIFFCLCHFASFTFIWLLNSGWMTLRMKSHWRWILGFVSFCNGLVFFFLMMTLMSGKPTLHIMISILYTSLLDLLVNVWCFVPRKIPVCSWFHLKSTSRSLKQVKVSQLKAEKGRVTAQLAAEKAPRWKLVQT